MIASPALRSAPSALTVVSVVSPAGTMIHARRGTSSFATKSSSAFAPVAPSASSAATAPGLTS